ncbi:GGDEF domain-containing protein [Candidatus Dependentiae bacterium]
MHCKICKQKNFLHPITLLPGSNQIYIETEKRLFQPFAFLFVDIDNFKPYNDKYGFYQGDLVIKKTAQIIKNALTKTDFIGHIGGDDFIILSTPNKVTNISQQICNNFDKQIIKFYNPLDQKHKKIITHDRKNNLVEFGIMTISIAIITNEYKKLTTIGQISQIAAELKNYAKTKPNGPGSNFVTERRKK